MNKFGKIIASLMVFSHPLPAAEWGSSVNTMVVMPGEGMSIAIPDGLQSALPAGSMVSVKDAGHWLLTAPDAPGFYDIPLQHQDSQAGQLSLVVMKPFNAAQQTSLGHYEIGTYPSPYKGLAQYAPPPGFIEVNKQDLDRQLTEHVQVRDLMCKQVSDFPKYLFVTNDGLAMLEDLLGFVQKQGVKVERFSFISGYRTPFYNRSIGNGSHSRHQYGDAFDLYVDIDNNQRMDDLDGDGKLTSQDVQVLYSLFEKFLAQTKYTGGLGRYNPSSNHGGFVHIDNRGFSARW